MQRLLKISGTVAGAILTDGRPILARLLRRGGIPRKPAPWSFALGLDFQRKKLGIPQTPARRASLGGPSCPSWSKVFAAITAITLTTACRIDMHVQPRQNPLSRSDFYSDQRSARPPVEGTVARGQLHEDSYFYTGKIGSNPGDAMPFPIT